MPTCCLVKVTDVAGLDAGDVRDAFCERAKRAVPDVLEMGWGGALRQERDARSGVGCCCFVDCRDADDEQPAVVGCDRERIGEEPSACGPEMSEFSRCERVGVSCEVPQAWSRG